VTEPDWQPTATPAMLERRGAFMAAIRGFMTARGVLEVDTPVLSRAAPSERGLASFAVDDAGYLAPSPEHALKRLLAVGAGPIYQLGHVFRSGEAGRWHNPEFCMLEWYRPQADVATLIEETSELIARVAGAPRAQRRRYRDVFTQHAGIDPIGATPTALAACAQSHGVAPHEPPADASRAFWLDLIMSLVVQPQLGHEGPVCIREFPADGAVLVETDPVDSRLAQRFECYWRGVELANGAQELVDADVARERMQGEIQAQQNAGQRPPPIDEALLAAMSAGLPRCAGVALGVDRLLALMLHCDSLSQVLAFDWARR